MRAGLVEADLRLGCIDNDSSHNESAQKFLSEAIELTSHSNVDDDALTNEKAKLALAISMCPTSLRLNHIANNKRNLSEGLEIYRQVTTEAGFTSKLKDKDLFDLYKEAKTIYER